jgi:hypothetical protein
MKSNDGLEYIEPSCGKSTESPIDRKWAYFLDSMLSPNTKEIIVSNNIEGEKCSFIKWKNQLIVL